MADEFTDEFEEAGKGTQQPQPGQPGQFIPVTDPFAGSWISVTGHPVK
jgi:hypothetical protein